MKYLITARISNDAYRNLVSNGKLMERLNRLMEEIKPEAFFFAANGKRTNYIIIDADNPTELPSVAEALYLGMDAEVEFEPILTPDDIAKIDLQKITEKWI